MLVQHGVSLTLEVTAEPGVEWMLTKESGRLPRLCGGLRQLLEGFPGVLDARPRVSLFIVKVMGRDTEWELWVVPFLLSTVAWFEEFVLPRVLEGVREGNWKGVVHVGTFLECKSPCLRGCAKDECSCAEQQIWRGSGWRRVRMPELHVQPHIGWWKGLTDGAGDLPDGGPWLRCPCGSHCTE